MISLWSALTCQRFRKRRPVATLQIRREADYFLLPTGYFSNILLTAFLIGFSTLLASAASFADDERFRVCLATPRKTLMSFLVSTRSTSSVPVATFISAAGFVYPPHT